MIAVAVTDTIKVTANVITTAATLDCVSDSQFSDLLLSPPSLPDPEIYTYTCVNICMYKYMYVYARRSPRIYTLASYVLSGVQTFCM